MCATEHSGSARGIQNHKLAVIDLGNFADNRIQGLLRGETGLQTIQQDAAESGIGDVLRAHRAHAVPQVGATRGDGGGRG